MKRVLILNAPCYGFGDILFAKKLADYLRSNFRVKVDLASTQPHKFLTLGENRVLPLNTSTGKHTECRRFKRLRFTPSEKYDYIFVAPLAQDSSKDLKDVRKIVPYATERNTYWFSEYGDETDKGIEFLTGVGPEYLGIFIDERQIRKTSRRSNQKKSVPYFFTYIATSDNVERWDKCIESFVSMVARKYTHFTKIKCMGSYATMYHLFGMSRYKLNKVLGKHWGTVKFMYKGEMKEWVFNKKKKGTFIFEPYKLPMTHQKIVQLMRNSLPDILITGDQSLSDVLSCCPDKNIWYQTTEWKEDFSKDLAKYLPQPYLKSPKTSCGSIKALNYKSDYRDFIRTQNFFTNAKPKLSRIFQ